MEDTLEVIGGGAGKALVYYLDANWFCWWYPCADYY